MARYITGLYGRELSWSDVFKGIALIAVPMLLVLKQPDMGTALTYSPILFAGLFLGGISWKKGLILTVAGLSLIVGVWTSGKILKPYQKARLTSFINPNADPRGTGYQILQSKIAVGDGFVGALFVLLLYFMILMRLIQNAQTASDLPGSLLIMGVVATLIFEIAVNIGMVVGLMPVTGIPLPLMSYGGSSVLFTFLALGMVMNVRMSRFVN
jgi:rod shape determining protein RodA